METIKGIIAGFMVVGLWIIIHITSIAITIAMMMIPVYIVIRLGKHFGWF